MSIFSAAVSDAPNQYLRAVGWEMVSGFARPRTLRHLKCGTEVPLTDYGLTVRAIQDYMVCPRCTEWDAALAYDPSNA